MSTAIATTARPGTPRRCTALTRRLAVAVAQRLGTTSDCQMVLPFGRRVLIAQVDSGVQLFTQSIC
jgi:hypothetical protein